MDGQVDGTLPLRGNCWVMQGSGTNIRIAKVRACYRSGGEVLLDLWMYSTEGEKLGRLSPALGGPSSFEPACTLDGWVRIEEPRFPLVQSWMPTGDGAQAAGYAGTRVIPFGSFSPQAPKPRAASPRRSDFDPHSEASARRLAAQEMRDLARENPAVAELLRPRAAKLEAEADRISPRR
jgi:hypothetical protein